MPENTFDADQPGAKAQRAESSDGPRMALWGLSAAALVLALSACGGADDSPADTATSAQPTVVSTAQGPVQGTLKDNVTVFLGVPYAESPVGARRWKAPAALAVRSGTYTAQEAKSGCTVAEDCLYLNIYKPAKASAASKLPVLMYIHGGGLGAGTPNDFDGSALANDNGVVVVTIAYRLGALGFLAHPALTAEAGGSSGNYGMLDQQAAMAWIRANIQGFGGDPANTTIFGQSAGGYSVYTHLASPLAAGLFDKAVVSSGAYMRIQPTLATAETFGQSDASKWGCTGTDAEVLACLRTLPAATARAGTGPVSGVWTPVIDGKLLKESTTEAFAAGRFNQVPTIVGSNHDEATSAAKNFASAPLASATWAFVAASVVKVGTPTDIAAQYSSTDFPVPTRAFTSAYGDYRFFCGMVAEAQRIGQWVPSTWSYEFAEQTPAQAIPGQDPATTPGPELAFYGPWGDFHSADLSYWFSQFRTQDQTASNLALSVSMRSYLANFARTGNPNGSGLPMWATVAANGGKVMSFATPLVPGADAATAHKCSYWGTQPPSASLI